MDGIEVSGIVSWPQAFVAVAIILALSVIPQVLGYLKARTTDAKVSKVTHELGNNGGKTIRDAIDRIEKKVTSQGSALDAHIAEAKGRDEADQVWRTQVEDLLTGGTTPANPPTPPRG